MMKMTGKAFAKKLFGAKYERLPRTLFMDVIVFWVLYIAGFQVQIASFVRVLMISAFTTGVMWQALSSRDNAVELKHMLMLPQHGREFVFSYVAVLGAYTLLTKTGLLLAALLAATAYSLRKYWYAGGIWVVAIVTSILFLRSELLLDLLLLVNSLFAILILWRGDGYAFYPWESEKSHGKAYYFLHRQMWVILPWQIT